MTRSRDVSQVTENGGVAIAPYTAGKNFVINGNFDIWQRGTSGLGASGTYTADRWYAFVTSNATIAQETSVVPNGATYSYRITSTGTNSYSNNYQAFEAQDVNFLAGKTITATAWVMSNSTFNATVSLAFDTNTTANTMAGGTWTNVLYGTAVTPSTSTFTKVTATYTVPSGTKGLRLGLVYNALVPNGSILYWGAVQLEVGSVATPFSRAGGTIQGELAACQRYYEIGEGGWVGYITSGNKAGSWVTFKSTKRTSPSMTATNDYNNTSTFNGTSVVASDITTDGFICAQTSVGTAVGYFFNKWTASSEL